MKKKLSPTYEYNKQYIDSRKAEGWIRRTFFGPKELITEFSKIWKKKFLEYRLENLNKESNNE